MNVLSLFDGMSCGQIALNRLGVKYDKYFASEIDKYAMQITKQNYPDTIHIGDVTAIKAAELPKIDLLMGGSPCQGFSFAGSQLAFDDPRSKLFFEFVRLLKELKPKYFLLENVRMKKEYLDIITEHLGVEPILINSALVSAQNRQRYYWTNIPGIAQPKDKGIVLKDILEKGFNSEKDKSYCLDANYYKGSSVENYIKKSRRQMVFESPKQVGIATDINGYDIIKRVYSENGKSPTLTTMGGGHREPKVMVKSMTEVRTPEANQIRYKHKRETGKDWSPRHMRHLVERDDDKMNTITASMTKQHIVKIMIDKTKPNQINPSKKAGGKQPYMQDRVFAEQGKAHALTASFANHTNVGLTKDTTQDIYWRKLTPLECERLQTVPDNYTQGVSNTQRYKMLGNGWTVDVICHILSNLYFFKGDQNE